MDFLVQMVTTILGLYLAGVNTLAVEVNSYLPEHFNADTLAKTTTTENGLVYIESKSAFGVIPDILIQNAEYQKASVVESIDPITAPATALEALVNIYCTYTTDTYTKTTTGTGFFIDTDGIILTNAHVAQFLLLEGLKGQAECIIRAGNPATPTYEAELLYLPPAWIREHASMINELSPKGTGERDYALLYVTSGLQNKPMPASFPTLPFDTDLMTLASVDTEIFATGYPAESIMAEGLTAPLIPKQATTSIGELMTFGSNFIDIFTLRGSSLGEHGSSGGPIVNEDGKAIGIISTRGDDELFGRGSLRAISISYIDRTIKEETGFTLVQNLGGNLPYRAKIFKNTLVPFLQRELQNAL